jgi:hypothetical protein
MVIIAGYQAEIDAFLEVNRGLESRFLWRYNIEKYSSEELKNIFIKKVRDDGWNVHETFVTGVNKKSGLTMWFEKKKGDFESSGRDIEKLFTFCKTAHSRRIFAKVEQEAKLITEEDMNIGHNTLLNNKKKKKNESNTHQFYYV